MKTIPIQLETHYQQQVTTIAYCWRITLKDGTKLGFTNHTDRIYIKAHGIFYEAESGFTATAIRNTNMLNVDDMDIDGAVNSDIVTEQDILSGRYNDADVLVFRVNYLAPEHGIEEMAEGNIGDVNVQNGFFKAELRSLTQNMQRPLLEITSPTCRARLGDERCKVDLTPFTFAGTVEITPEPNLVFACSTLTQAENYFKYGFITFTSGDNLGVSYEVKANKNGLVSLQMPTVFAMQAGDAFSIVAGCDGALATCRDKFDNILNMRAEPYIPTTDKILQRGGA